jgi:hypothetical protein
MLASPFDFTKPKQRGKILKESAFYNRDTTGFSIKLPVITGKVFKSFFSRVLYKDLY